MDELFAIEAIIGEVAAIIGLQFEKEEEFIREDLIEWEKFPEPVVVEAKPKAEGDGEEPAIGCRGKRCAAGTTHCRI